MKKIDIVSWIYGIVIFVLYPIVGKLYVLSAFDAYLSIGVMWLFRLIRIFIIPLILIMAYVGHKNEYIKKEKFSYRKNLLFGSVQAFAGIVLSLGIFYAAYMVLSRINIFYKYNVMFRVIYLLEETDINAHIHIVVLLFTALFMNAVCVMAATKKARRYK